MKHHVISKYRDVMNIRLILPCALLLAGLTGCEELGIPDPEKEAARKQAEGEAIGSACRQTGRALEDCFERNPKSPKAAIFAGWRSMNDYMTENNIPTVAPAMPAPAADDHAQKPADEDGTRAAGRGGDHSRRIDPGRNHG